MEPRENAPTAIIQAAPPPNTPGVGKLIYDAILGSDFNLALLALMLATVVTLFSNLAADPSSLVARLEICRPLLRCVRERERLPPARRATRLASAPKRLTLKISPGSTCLLPPPLF